MENPSPVRYYVSWWREGFKELSCLTPLPLRYLDQTYSQVHCKYIYFLPSWPCGCSCFLRISGLIWSSSVRTSFTFSCRWETPWHTCTRNDRRETGISCGCIMQGLRKSWKFRTWGFLRQLCCVWKEEPWLLLMKVLNVEQIQHLGIFEQIIAAYMYLEIHRYICMYAHM